MLLLEGYMYVFQILRSLGTVECNGFCQSLSGRLYNACIVRSFGVDCPETLQNLLHLFCVACR
jgi:hypothetical protein